MRLSSPELMPTPVCEGRRGTGEGRQGCRTIARPGQSPRYLSLLPSPFPLLFDVTPTMLYLLRRYSTIVGGARQAGNHRGRLQRYQSTRGAVVRAELDT